MSMLMCEITINNILNWSAEVVDLEEFSMINNEVLNRILTSFFGKLGLI